MIKENNTILGTTENIKIYNYYWENVLKDSILKNNIKEKKKFTDPYDTLTYQCLYNHFIKNYLKDTIRICQEKKNKLKEKKLTTNAKLVSTLGKFSEKIKSLKSNNVFLSLEK
jgi:hypothetical protein